MFYGDKREDTRKPFFDAWDKHQNKKPLTPLENQILSVILQHPEYHDLLNDPANYLDKDYTPEMGQTNPFMHMSLHIAILEQTSTHRPAGIADIFASLECKYGRHEAHHKMIEALMIELHSAMTTGATAFNNERYLENLQKLL